MPLAVNVVPQIMMVLRNCFLTND